MIPLQESIEVWKEHRAQTDPTLIRLGGSNCPLCRAHSRCDKCPIAYHTEARQCFNTPYYEAIRVLALWETEPDHVDYRNKWQEIAGEMVELLEEIEDDQV